MQQGLRYTRKLTTESPLAEATGPPRLARPSLATLAKHSRTEHPNTHYRIFPCCIRGEGRFAHGTLRDPGPDIKHASDGWRSVLMDWN